MTSKTKTSGILKALMPGASQAKPKPKPKPKPKSHDSQPHDATHDDDGGIAAAATPATMPTMGDRLVRPMEVADRKRKQQNKAQSRVRSVESEVYSSIGRVLSDAAKLKDVCAIDLLGLADHVAEALDKPEIWLQIRQRGIALYEADYARAKALCMLGAEGNKDAAEALRAAGFVLANHLWAGPALIAEAISIALAHGLTLLRHQGHETIYYIRKGKPGPALAELEAERAALLAGMLASLPAAPTPSEDENEDEDEAEDEVGNEDEAPSAEASADAAVSLADQGSSQAAVPALEETPHPEGGAPAPAANRTRIAFGKPAPAAAAPAALAVSSKESAA